MTEPDISTLHIANDRTAATETGIEKQVPPDHRVHEGQTVKSTVLKVPRVNKTLPLGLRGRKR